MAIGFPAGITSQYIVNNAQSKLAALRNALDDCENFYQWLSAYAITDLEAAPVSLDAVSAQAILTAFADANALVQLYRAGLPPATYPQPPSSYVYGSSQRVVIGPLS